jgi:hypothetical protein
MVATDVRDNAANALDVANDPVAHAALKQAHDAGYKFPADFAGFTATLAFIQDGVAVSGRVTVKAPRDIEFDIDADEAAIGWLKQEIGSMAGHRWPTSYEAGDGRWTLTLGDDATHPLGQTVTVHDDPFNSSYRLRDGQISQVSRQMGGTRFTITILAHQVAADERNLPSVFTVAYWDIAEGRLTRADAYTDRYATVAGTSLPVGRRVVTSTDTGQTTRELILNGHELLTGEASTAAPDAARRAHS